MSSGIYKFASWETCAHAIQFNPQVGDVDNNIKRAEALLAEASPKDLDLLVLPEMAFSGKYESI